MTGKISKIVMLNNAATLRITHAIIKRRRPKQTFTIVFVAWRRCFNANKATCALQRFLLVPASLRQELKRMLRAGVPQV